MIIPVRVEESEIGAIDIARDMESMWPDAIIEKYARAEWKIEVLCTTNLNKTQLQRYAVKEALCGKPEHFSSAGISFWLRYRPSGSRQTS